MKFIYVNLVIFMLLAGNNNNNSVIEALRCYTCTYVAESTLSRDCIENPDLVEGSKITNCNRTYCTIQRQELADSPGFINTFLRGCEDKPMNDLVEDYNFKTYFRSCNSDLCNDGNGIKLPGGGLTLDGEPSENLLVPGMSSSAYRNWTNKFSAIVAILLFCLTLN